MSELTSGDLWQFGNWLMGLISLFIMMITGDFFWLFYVALFFVMFAIHSFLGMKKIDIDYLSKRALREIEFKKYEAVLNELREIRKTLQKKR